jgi:type VI secretion system VasD/TssJ family lipoprotein
MTAVSQKISLSGVKMCRVLAACILPFLASGCYSTMTLYTGVVGAKDMNSGGHAVVVSVYQLKSETNFLRVPVESFWQEGAKSFDGDLVETKTDVMLLPGETKWLTLTLKNETRFIGAAGDFRRPDQKGWRQVYAISERRPDELWVIVGYDGLKIEKPRR